MKRSFAHTRSFNFLAVIAFYALFQPLSFAQERSGSSCLLPLVVRTAEGEVLRDLTAADLDLKLNGNILPIKSVQRESRPRRIVILLDASGSMGENSTFVPWQQALDSAVLLAKLSEGRAQLALLIFNNKILQEIPFSADSGQVLRRLTDLQKDLDFAKHEVRGSTRLKDTMNHALQLLGEPSSADVLYLSTDGEDTDSHISTVDMKKRILASGVRIFLSLPVRNAPYRNRTPDELNAVDDMVSLVQNSGGDFMQITNGGLNLSFRTRPKTPVLEGVKLFLEGLFENQVMEVAASQIDSRRQKLTLAAATSTNLGSGIQFTLPRHFDACSVH